LTTLNIHSKIEKRPREKTEAKEQNIYQRTLIRVLSDPI